MKIVGNCSKLVTPTAVGQLLELDGAALVFESGVLSWVGREVELPEVYSFAERVDGGGCLVIPGLVDCHTHLAFGGSRAAEFEQRLLGASYLEIARAGGGIQSTVRATREASSEELVERAAGFLGRMAGLGVTTVECKSGYGLSVEEELRLLEVYQQLSRSQPVRVVSTLLGAHVIGPEFADDRAGYVDLVCEEMVPRAASAGLASFCDVFVEEGAFSAAEAKRILNVASEHGLRGKLHVDQLHDVGGGKLAAEVGAISADHLEHTSETGIEAMAEAGVVAVSLPLATFFLRQPPMPARRFLDAGVPVAVATDFNPGSAPSYHLPLAMLLAAVMQGMTAREALEGATLSAAKALGLEKEIGSLEPGKAADFALVEAPSLEDWIYTFEANRVTQTWIGGERL